MHAKYNTILRDMTAKEDADKCDNLYPTTLGLIVSGILKLCRIAKMPEAGVVFRGLSGIALPGSFFELDGQGFAGGVDPGFMSTSVSEEVARKYSVSRQGGSNATIFRLQLGKMSLGADVSWLSQFAGEEEMLFPPRTHLEVVGESRRGADGVVVVTLKPTVFQNVRTVEEVEESRREHVKQMSSSLVWEVRNQAAREGRLDSELAERLDALERKLVADNCSQHPAWYNDSGKYKSALLSLFSDAEMARTAVLDSSSLLSRILARQGEADDLKEGSAVEIHSLRSAPQHNGERGEVVRFSGDNGRWEVRLTGSGKVLALKPGNLTPLAPDNRPDTAVLHPPPAGVHAAAASNAVCELHFKFWQDPDFKGIRSRFGTDQLFAAGIVALVGPMDVQVCLAVWMVMLCKCTCV